MKKNERSFSFLSVVKRRSKGLRLFLITVSKSGFNIGWPFSTKINVQKSPIGVEFIDERFLFFPSPSFYFLFPGNGVPYVFVPFVVNQVITKVSASEGFRLAAVDIVFLEPSNEVGGSSDVERFFMKVGENIHPKIVFPRHVCCGTGPYRMKRGSAKSQ
jgi:hypothetical protein